MVFRQMLAKNISRVARRFLRQVQQAHMHFLHSTPTFVVVAPGTGCHNIRPDMLATHMAWNYVIDSEATVAFSTILAGIIVATEHLPTCQLDMWARAMHLHLQPND